MILRNFPNDAQYMHKTFFISQLCSYVQLKMLQVSMHENQIGKTHQQGSVPPTGRHSRSAAIWRKLDRITAEQEQCPTYEQLILSGYLDTIQEGTPACVSEGLHTKNDLFTFHFVYGIPFHKMKLHYVFPPDPAFAVLNILGPNLSKRLMRNTNHNGTVTSRVLLSSRVQVYKNYCAEPIPYPVILRGHQRY